MLDHATVEDRQQGWDYIAAAFDMYVKFGNTKTAISAASTPVMITGLQGPFELTSKALELLDPDSLEAGYLHTRHGISFNSKSDFTSELKSYDRALEIAKQHGDQRLEGRVNVHYGQHYFSIGDPEKSLEFL